MSSSSSDSEESGSDASYRIVKPHKFKSKSRSPKATHSHLYPTPAGPPPTYHQSQHSPQFMRTPDGMSQHYEATDPIHPIAAGGRGANVGAIPSQGRRYQTDTHTQFPSIGISGSAPFRDWGGEGVWVGSAIFGESVHPCKLAPHLQPAARVPYGGSEYGHEGRYDLLPITEDHEWVPTSHGRIPADRRPVDGGHEESGERLYHAVAVVQGVSVPGKTGLHLGRASVAFGNQEVGIKEGYWILCWRD